MVNEGTEYLRSSGHCSGKANLIIIIIFYAIHQVYNGKCC